MLSIVIPVYNNQELTQECITAIRENTRDCELIIIDNGSTPPMAKPWAGFIDVTLIRNEENLGFPKAVNQGIRAAKGDVIILLNNDVIVTPRWADKLVSALNDFDIVGPMTNFASGVQQITLDTYETKDELNKVALDVAETYGDSVREVNFIVGFCMAFTKALYDEIGEFDESMWPCSGEEVDFCLRARQTGKHIGIVEGCYAHHEGSQTFKIMQNAGECNYDIVVKSCNEHLGKKWGMDFWERQEIDSSPRPEGLCLNLGCGYRHLDGYINIDNRPECKPDMVCDVIPGPFGGLPYSDNSVDIVRAYDFLEHIQNDKTIAVMDEIWRVLKPGGIFESLTPDAEVGQGAFQDPTHVSFWVENKWTYFSDEAHRNLYGIRANFTIESLSRKEYGQRVFHLHVIAKAVKP